MKQEIDPQQHNPPQLSPESDHDQYPEGGLKAWSVVLGAWCAMIPSMGLLNSLGTLQPWTSTHQLKDYSESSIGWIYGAYTFFLFLGGAQFGAILDSHGPLYVVLPGSIGIVLSLILLSFSHEYYQIFLSFSVLGGISASTLFTPPLAAVGHWFNVRRGWATGVACTAGGVGGCIFPLIILFAAPRIGFEWAIRIIALVCAVTCSIACLTVRTRLPPKKAVTSVDFKALKDTKYASATLSVFFAEFSAFIPITYITSYTLHAGFDEQLSYAVLVFLNLGAVFGRFLPGLVADRLGRFNVMIMSCLICSLLTLALWLSGDLVDPDSLGIVISYAVLFGFWSGSAISIAPVCISQVCEIQDYGKRVGTTWTIVSFGTLIAIPIAGAIQQHNNGEYYGLIIFGGVLYISSTIAFVISRGICKGWGWGIKF
ncbi:Sucrose/H+ symporter, plant [Penicillium camemberti]|uniref:Sucrose/H+ symporter, plant n=1 Tax=Penicillium camemberti (strain FM 013) TaxID=1429867 RepID=A0A0G4PVM9_PENC3|nr:Sucrose/H+ symporter, plant [Penicillium camemberti]